ncbi:hypothetical protein TWF694_005470 [Orbilia ellipsospora]|uniref:polynucleotide adenylyltransferase n=1 Tax=Orbilia ellipsospora TaxID=2528407 RepID=A0AAV9WVM8_9PEZI
MTSLTFPPSDSPDTALALVLPSSHLDIIQPFRSLYDAAAIKWPPHINLFYPFVHSSALESVSEYLTQTLPSICETPLTIRFSDVEIFRGGKKRPSFLVLRPDKESEKLLQDVYELLSREFPDIRKAVKRDFKPHLTIGQVHNGGEGKLQHFAKKFKMLCQQIGEVDLGLAVMRRVNRNMQFVSSWGVQEYPVALSPECVPGNVIKRQAWTLKQVYQDDEEVEEVENRWEPVAAEGAEKLASQNFTLSTYNVFIDIDDSQTQHDRWLKICKTLVHTNSTIVCLQEVSDDLLAVIGNSWRVRQKYPYISHSPEKPLLRARNCVIISSVPFQWEEVASAVQGRSICIAKFPQYGYYSSSTEDGAEEDEDEEHDQKIEKPWHPLVVSNVHLPAYINEEAIQKRGEYTKEIKSYLNLHYPSNPVLIVGDTNIHNDTTIQDAVNQKVISESSAAEYANLFPIGEYSDAWLISGEGLNGNTFDPTTNHLALENAQNASSVPIKPQRFDRIYSRKQGGDNLLIREVRVALDAEQDSPASDHYILNARLSFVDTEKTASTATLLELPQTSLKDSDLRDLLVANNCFPGLSEAAIRNQAVQSLEACLKGHSDLTTPESQDSTFQLRLVPVGSYGLDTYAPSSDIDCLAVGTISTSLFWRVAKQRIKKWRGSSTLDVTSPTSPLSVKIVRYVDAQIPMLILLIGDKIRIDLQYCTAVKIVENWSSIPTAPLNSPLFNLTVPTLKKLQAYRDMLYILNTVPNLATFRLAYRFLKLWAEKKGIYSSKFGFFGGVHLTLLLSRISILLPPSASASQLIVSFFQTYATFKWTEEMVTIPNTGRTIRYQRAARDKMVVLTITTPAVNVAANATIHTLRTLTSELENAAAKVAVDASFTDIAGTFGDVVSSLSDSVGDFLSRFNRYIKVDVQFWGTNRQGGRALVGWVESRLVYLLTELGRNTPTLTARVWPGRFHEVATSAVAAALTAEEEDERAELRGFYLIGLAPAAGTELTKEEKKLSESAFSVVLQTFETTVKRKEKYDEKDSWIAISCVKHANLTTDQNHIVQLDKSMIWDGGEADEEGDTIPDSDDEDSEENEMVDALLGDGATNEFDDFFGPSFAKKGKKKSAQSAGQKSGPTPKLRPSHEVFNRIKWDGKYDASGYVVGYEDRFRGVLEIGADKWKTEMTDEEFVPMHRVVYFKERKTGNVVWDREKRIDLIFGSGKAEETKKGKKH